MKMDHIEKCIQSTLDKNYHLHRPNLSTIHIQYDVMRYEIPDLKSMMQTIIDTLDYHQIKYKITRIPFLSEYPCFSIYDKDKNIGIVVFDMGLYV